MPVTSKGQKLLDKFAATCKKTSLVIPWLWVWFIWSYQNKKISFVKAKRTEEKKSEMREGIEERIFPNNTIFLPYTNYYLEVGAPNADLQKCSYCDKSFATSPPLGWHRRVAPGPSYRRTSAREWSGDLGAQSGVKGVHFIEQSWGGIQCDDGFCFVHLRARHYQRAVEHKALEKLWLPGSKIVIAMKSY